MESGQHIKGYAMGCNMYLIIVIFISALVPSRRAAKVSPIEAIRQNDDIKINKKKIKTGKLVNKLFGIDVKDVHLAKVP